MIYTTQNVQQSNIKQQRAKTQLHCAPLCPLYQNQILIFCPRCHLEIELLYPTQEMKYMMALPQKQDAESSKWD